MKKQILLVRLRKRTLCLVIADYHTREVYALYFHICSKQMWERPQYQPHFGASDVPLWRWLCFCMGRSTEGYLLKTKSRMNDQKQLYHKGALYTVWQAGDRAGADLLHYFARYRVPVKLRMTETGIRFRMCGKLPEKSKHDRYDYSVLVQAIEKKEQEENKMDVRKAFQAGSLVLSAPDSDYPCMLGHVFNVIPAGSPEQETENETDDIYVDFQFTLDGCKDMYREQLEKHFQALYDDDSKLLEDVPLDFVIMAPDELIVLSNKEWTAQQERILSDMDAAGQVYKTLAGTPSVIS